MSGAIIAYRLAPVYGCLSHRQFIDYARRGLLTNAVIARAMQ